MITIYDRLGDDLLQQMLDTFYDKVIANELISPLFQTDMDVVKQKQFMFLSQFFGGPPRYAEAYGHPMMRMRHLPHKITKAAAMEWLKCMNEAISTLPIEEEFKDEIFNRFPPVAAHMVNC